MDQRAKVGRLQNPIRFTGYQILKELGLTFSGENYEDINRWGQRMADTTITSEQVMYLAARKKYANKTIHVFRSFMRAGRSDGASRADYFEVVLEDWLLENLNHSYVIPEDFNVYRQLKRPTAKGIFGYLHLWFHASQGRPVEKDYNELCMLLNIPVYRHLSKIRETMGRSLDELKQIGYLSDWDIRPMVTKAGFKLVLYTSPKLLQVLALSQRKGLLPGQTEEAAQAPQAFPPQPFQLDARQSSIKENLARYGVVEEMAETLARSGDPDHIQDQIEYVSHLLARDRRGKIENPAGFLIYVIKSRLPVPPAFVSSRQRTMETESSADEHRTRLDESYGDYVRNQVEEELERRFPGAKREKQVKAIISNRVRCDAEFAQLDAPTQRTLAEELMRQEIQSSGLLATFDEWCETTTQASLFPALAD
jgi:hypothetical protein